MNKKQNIRLLSLEEIKDQTIQLGEKAFRAKQLWEWLWKRNALSFEEMDTLPKAFRESLAEKFDLLPLKVKTQQGRRQNSLKNENTTAPRSNPAYRKSARCGASHLTRGDRAVARLARTNRHAK